jgi:hypothetical protein
MDLQDFPEPGNPPHTSFVSELVRRWRIIRVQIKTMLTSYVEREQATNLKWIDGKIIFQKTVAISEAFCETNATAIAHGISDFGELIRAEGRFKAGTNWYALPYVAASAGIGFRVNATNITSQVDGSPAFTSWGSGYVTLWYTKT